MSLRDNPPRWLLALVLLGVLGGVGALVFFSVSDTGPPTPRESRARPTLPGALPAPPPDPFTTMTPAEHIAELKKALADWKPHKDPMTTYWGRLGDADRHYNILPTEDQRRPNVVKLKAALERRKRESGRLAGMVVREAFAKPLEQHYLDKGLDVYVSLEGPDKTTLTLTFVLFSRPLVHQFSKDTKAIAALREAGVKKVWLTDGYDQTWTLDLS